MFSLYFLYRHSRHVGDLGNIIVEGNGRVKTTITDEHVQLQGDNSVIGKAIVV